MTTINRVEYLDEVSVTTHTGNVVPTQVYVSASLGKGQLGSWVDR